MRIVFLGTPVFVVPVLEQLSKSHEIVAVFCQSDKPGNRGKIEVSPVKTFALENNIQLFQPDKITNEIVSEIQHIKPDVMVVAAYGKLLPQNFLDICPCLNIHPSDLPKYRGSAPIQTALLNGDEKIGVSVMKLCLKMDAGDVIQKQYIPVGKDDNAKTLLEKSFCVGALMLDKILKDLGTSLKNGIKQDDNEATFCKMLEKSDGKIDFSKHASAIENQVKALFIWPVAHCKLNGKNFKIFSAQQTSFEGNFEPGEVAALTKEGIVVACEKSFILLKEVQIENGKRMDARNFINGNNIKVGDKLC